ncbi:MAG: LTA synthase family protein [Eggerthellaceae bacterium]
MNETFSDLSRFESLEGTAARPTHYYELAQESLAWGTAYASAFGAGTCNSEFEFLTGSSMGNFGDGVYPYVLYDLGGNENLVTYFKSLGYATRAIHPADAANWRRDRVYEQLGFDEFADQRAFANADATRAHHRPRHLRLRVDLLEADEGPQFVFDVTLQNHGGYDAEACPTACGERALRRRQQVVGLDSIASVMRQADRDRHLVDRLNISTGRGAMLFGDRQPGFSDWLFRRPTTELQQTTWGSRPCRSATVPYLIWANDAARAQGAHEPQGVAHERTSLNYLGSRLVEAAGLPTTSYQRFLLAMREAVPAINLNGFLTADGIWHGFGNEEAAGVLDALQAYATVQYDNLFNKDSAWAVK